MKATTTLLALLLFFVLFLSSCNKNQPKSIGEEPLALDELSFDYDIATFYSKNHNFNGQDDYIMFHKDTTFIYDHENKKPKPIRLEYNQVSSTSTDKLASYGNVYFPVINAITNLENKIGLICVRKEIESNELKKLIASISKNMGKFKKSKGDFFSDYDMLIWENNNRILKLCIVFDNEDHTIKLNIDQNTGAITSGKKTPHLNCYLFIANKKQSSLLETLDTVSRSGDFVYY